MFLATLLFLKKAEMLLQKKKNALRLFLFFFVANEIQEQKHRITKMLKEVVLCASHGILKVFRPLRVLLL